MIRRTFFVSLVFSLSSLSLVVEGSGLTHARVTVVTGTVQLSSTNEPSHSGSVGDDFAVGGQIVTGAGSRAELTFNNETTVRLGGNAELVFRHENILTLNRGTVLFESQRHGKAKIEAGETAVTLSKETALLSYGSSAFKFLVLEGIGRLYRPHRIGDSVLVHAGEMVFGKTNSALTDPVDFKIDVFTKSCPLITTFPQLLTQQSIAEAVQRQQLAISKRRLVETNLIIPGGGSTVSVDDRPNAHPETTNLAANTLAIVPESARVEVLTAVQKQK